MNDFVERCKSYVKANPIRSAAVAAVLLLAWWSRNDVVTSGNGAVFKVNRWTGDVVVCSWYACKHLEQE